MAVRDSSKSSIPKPSGIPKPSKGSPDQAQTPGVSQSSSLPIKRKSTVPKPLGDPRRSLLPGTNYNSQPKKDQHSISSQATSAVVRSNQCRSKGLHSRPLKGPKHQQPPSKIATRDGTVRAKEGVKREPSAPVQHHLNTPASLGNLRESEPKDLSKLPLRQTKSALPVLRNPCAATVDPSDCSPTSGVGTDATTNATNQSTPSSDRTSTDVSDPREKVTNDAETPCSEITSLIHALEHFTFLAVLDRNSLEKPVVCESQFPWSSTQLLEKLDQFYVDALQQDGKVSEIISDTSSEGLEKSYLALVSNFSTIIPGNREYSLACVVDITSFVNAAVPGERIHEPRAANEATMRNGHSNSKESPIAPLSFKDKLATAVCNNGDARRKVSVARRERRSLRLQHYLAKNAQESYALDDLVGRTVAKFTERFIEFYGDCFMLELSSSDKGCYEMTHVSDNLYKKEDFDGHLTHNTHEVFKQARTALKEKDRFTIRVLWGHEATEKRLYCVPLIDHETEGWVCLLVDSEVPLLWHTGYRGYFG